MCEYCQKQQYGEEEGGLPDFVLDAFLEGLVQS